MSIPAPLLGPSLIVLLMLAGCSDRLRPAPDLPTGDHPSIPAQVAPTPCHLTSAPPPIPSPRSSSDPAIASRTDATQIAEHAYLLGYPLLESARIIHATAQAAPGAFLHQHRAVAANDRILQTPDPDTPISLAAVHLGHHPVLISLPAASTAFRYLVQVMDLEGRGIFVRTPADLADEPCRLMLIGPDATAPPPPADTQILHVSSRWALVHLRWITGAADGAPALIEMCSRCQITTTASAADHETSPAIDDSTMISPGCFPALAGLLQHQLRTGHKVLRQDLADLGLVPGHPHWDPAALDDARRSALELGMTLARKRLMDLRIPRDGPGASAWIDLNPASDGDAATRTSALAHGLMWPAPAAAAWFSATDRQGQALHGGQRYVLRFQSTALPVAEGGWSLTAYDTTTGQLSPPYPGPPPALQGRLALGSHTPGLTYVEDGSLTVYVQHHPPGDQRNANWLPCPAGPFHLCLYAVLPDPAGRDGRYQPPGLQALGSPSPKRATPDIVR